MGWYTESLCASGFSPQGQGWSNIQRSMLCLLRTCDTSVAKLKCMKKHLTHSRMASPTAAPGRCVPLFFPLEYAGELRIIVLRRRTFYNPVSTRHTHTGTCSVPSERKVIQASKGQPTLVLPPALNNPNDVRPRESRVLYLA